MRILAIIAALFVSMSHFGFMILEMFYWDHEIGHRLFSLTPELAAETALLAANQGLYNGFLAAGLLWGVVAGKRDVIIFFLLCVVVAGVFGALTVSPRIFVTQATPALIALVLTLAARKRAE